MPRIVDVPVGIILGVQGFLTGYFIVVGDWALAVLTAFTVACAIVLRILLVREALRRS